MILYVDNQSTGTVAAGYSNVASYPTIAHCVTVTIKKCFTCVSN